MSETIIEISTIIGVFGAIFAVVIMVSLGWLPRIIGHKLPYEHFPKVTYLVGGLIFMSHFAFTAMFLSSGSLLEADTRFTDWIMALGIVFFCAGLWPYLIMSLFLTHAKKEIFKK